MNNKEFSETKEFRRLCEEAKIKLTVRQASKFRNKKGSLYEFSKRKGVK